MKTLSPIDRIIAANMELHRVLRHKVPVMKSTKGDLSILQFQFLFYLREMPKQEMTMKEIAQHLHIASPTATTFVDRLIAMNVVERRSDPKNRKIVRVHLTKKGSKAIADQFEIQHKAMRNLFSMLSAADQNTLARILERVLSDISSSSL